MNKLLIGLLILGSISSYAFGSEFERGYNAGKERCHIIEEDWLCQNPEFQSTNWSGSPIIEKGFITSRGRSRAEAISKFETHIIKDLISQEKVIECRKL